MKVYQTYKLASKWTQLTSTDFRRFVDFTIDADVIPNTSALEDFLQPNDDESIAEALERKFGKKAVEIIRQLFEQ